MQLQARLVHAEPGARVVEVSAHHQGELLGSALGEAPTAEAAEDRALSRLQQRLRPQPTTSPAARPQPRPTPAPEPATSSPKGLEPQAMPPQPVPSQPVPRQPLAPAAVPPPSQPPTSLPPTSAPPEPVPDPAPPAAAEPIGQPMAEPPPDPDDWSSELAQLDLELRRIGWQREQEEPYLERAFGHPSRSRLTSYSDLVAYLQALQHLAPGSDPTTAPIPLRRRDLLSQCDQLLGQLGWTATQGRQFLERHFQLSSRQQLSDSQLLQFNMLLEGELIGV